MSPLNLPSLDAHVHVAPDVTQPQLDDLGHTHVFAMTRNLDEAEAVHRRDDGAVTWGLGVHPARPDALLGFDGDRFAHLLESFGVVGEIGLDRRGVANLQRSVFIEILRRCSGEPVLLSIHTAGRVPSTLECLRRAPHTGAILHWFLGTPTDLDEAVRLGAYFSVNAAMPSNLLDAIPADRVLTETDFPARNTKARLPGDVAHAEEALAAIWEVPLEVARHRVWTNLKALLIDSGAIDRVGEGLADTVLAV